MPTVKGQFPQESNLANLSEKTVQINGAIANAASGSDAAGKADLNQDGRGDVFLCAPTTAAQFLGSGFALFNANLPSGVIELYNVNGINGVEFKSPTPGAFFCSDVFGSGNITANNKDGVVFGHARQGVSGPGATYVVDSKPNWITPTQLSLTNSSIDLALTGYTPLVTFTGDAVCAVDLDGNGRKEIISGSYFSTLASVTGRGMVFSVNLSDSSVTTPFSYANLNGFNGYELDGMLTSPTLAPSGCCGYFGNSLAPLKNVIGTGTESYIAGAPGAVTLNLPGYAAIALRPSSTTPRQVDTSPDVVIVNGELPGDHAGTDVSGYGSKGGHLISAPKASPPGRPNGGKLYLGYPKNALVEWTSPVSLSSYNGSLQTGSTFFGKNANDEFATVAVEIDDFDGDGNRDFAVGTPLADFSPTVQDSGEIDIFLGKPEGQSWGSPVEVASLSANERITIKYNQAGAHFGATIAAIGDADGDGVGDIIACAPLADPDATRIDAGICWIIHGDIPPELVTNELAIPPLTSVSGNITIPFGANALAAIDGNHDNSTLTYVLQNITNSYIQHKLNRGVALANFTQQQVNDWDLELVIPNTAANSSFLMKLVTTGLAYLGPVPANIIAAPSTVSPAPTPVATSRTPSVSPSSASPSYSPTFLPSFSPSATPSTPPTPTPGIGFVHNAMTLANCEAVTLTPAILQATKPGANDSLIQYMVGNLHDGRFYLKRDNISTNSFPHYQVAAGDVEFRHACTNKTPTYSVIASEGATVTEPNDAVITFANAPQVTLNPINLDRGQTITLTSAHIDITVNDGTIPRLVIITVTGLQNGWLENNGTVPPTQVTSFTLEDFDAGLIQLVSDGSAATPSFTISVSSATSATAAITPRVIYSDRGIVAPRLRNNYLIVNQGQAATVAPLQFSAVDGYGQPVSDLAVYQQSSLQHGQFTVNATPTTTFTPAQLRQGAVEFRDDNTGAMPDFWTSVTANGLQSPAYPGTVFYTPEVAPPTIAPTSLPTSVAQVQSTPWYKTAGGIGGLGAAALAVSAAVGLFWYCYDKKSSQSNSHEDKEDKESYENKVVMPVAAKINELMDVSAKEDPEFALKVAATAILTELRDGHDLGKDIDQWDAPRLKAFINNIGVKTLEVIRQQKNRQGPDEPVIFSKRVHVTPNEIKKAAEAIAQAVYDHYEIAEAEASNRTASSMEMGQLSPKPSGRKAPTIEIDRGRAKTEEQDHTPPAHAGESVEPEDGSTPSQHSDEADTPEKTTPEKRTPERAVDEELQSSDLQLTTEDKGRSNKLRKKRK